MTVRQRGLRRARPRCFSLTDGGSMDGYYAWMLVATALVLMMTTPALALFYGGMTRSKSVLNMMMMSYITFAVITAALISGAIADRVKLSSWVVFLPIWVTLCYFPIAHNVWGGGWFYSHFPNLDYAGGTVVHINAGIAGGVLALIIGRRFGFMRDPMKPHNLTLTMIGAGLLWFGWYGFNVGSMVFTDGTTKAWGGFSAQFQGEMGTTFLNTTLAT